MDFWHIFPASFSSVAATLRTLAFGWMKGQRFAITCVKCWRVQCLDAISFDQQIKSNRSKHHTRNVTSNGDNSRWVLFHYDLTIWKKCNICIEYVPYAFSDILRSHGIISRKSRLCRWWSDALCWCFDRVKMCWAHARILHFACRKNEKMTFRLAMVISMIFVIDEHFKVMKCFDCELKSLKR